MSFCMYSKAGYSRIASAEYCVNTLELNTFFSLC